MLKKYLSVKCRFVGNLYFCARKNNKMINSVMNRLQDFTFFSQLMANANMGWWKANLSTAKL